MLISSTFYIYKSNKIFPQIEQRSQFMTIDNKDRRATSGYKPSIISRIILIYEILHLGMKKCTYELMDIYIMAWLKAAVFLLPLFSIWLLTWNIVFVLATIFDASCCYPVTEKLINFWIINFSVINIYSYNKWWTIDNDNAN